MNPNRYNQLLNKLNSRLKFADVCDVSPTLGLSGDGNASPDALYITPDMDVESLSDNNLYLAHTMLHSFYAGGGNKSLSPEQIENLHNQISKKINHVNFDKLDRK